MNRNLLLWLIDLLADVAANESVNKMGPRNLGNDTEQYNWFTCCQPLWLHLIYTQSSVKIPRNMFSCRRKSSTLCMFSYFTDFKRNMMYYNIQSMHVQNQSIDHSNIHLNSPGTVWCTSRAGDRSPKESVRLHAYSHNISRNKLVISMILFPFLPVWTWNIAHQTRICFLVDNATLLLQNLSVRQEILGE